MPDTRLTHSRIACFQACPRKHLLAYELALRPVAEAQALRFGTAFHLGREAYRADHADAQAPVNAAIAAYDAAYPDDMSPEQRESWLVERVQMARLLSAYIWRWAEADAAVKHLATEGQFEIPLVNPDTGRPIRAFTLAGKRDGIDEIEGRVAVNEFKTTAQDLSPDGDYRRKLLIDAQVSTYVAAGRTVYPALNCCLYDMVRKPTIRPKKLTQAETARLLTAAEYFGERFAVAGDIKDGATVSVNGETCPVDRTGKWPVVRETAEMYGARLTADIGERPDYYFARQMIGRTDAELAEAQYDLWATAKTIRECELANRWPKNTGACLMYGRCKYFALCTGGYDWKSGTVPDGYTRVENVHQELVDEGE